MSFSGSTQNVRGGTTGNKTVRMLWGEHPTHEILLAHIGFRVYGQLSGTRTMDMRWLDGEARLVSFSGLRL